MERIFVVPNNDGEAVEIQKLLRANREKFLVTNQQWGASWEGLEPEIKEAISSFNGSVYGVELQGYPCVSGGINIDHHKYENDDRTNPLSSLEQVANVIGVELSYFQMAVSDRDKGHITLMTEHGFPMDIINLVGTLDRKAQGITEVQEKQSLEVCSKVFDIVKDGCVENLIVHIPHGKCMTVRDVLFYNYKNILIFSPDNEFNYYGDGEMCIKLNKKFGGWLSSNAKLLGHGFAGGYAKEQDVKNFFGKYDLEV